jgi:hypothetical protein
MKQGRKYLILIFVVVLIGCGVATYIKCRENFEKNRVNSTMESMAAVIYTQLNDGNKKIEVLFSRDVKGWSSLTDDQYDKLITEITKSSAIEYWTVGKFPEILLDPWGNRFVVCYKKANQDHEILIVSKGPDGIYGTKDDLVNEYGISSPPLN